MPTDGRDYIYNYGTGEWEAIEMESPPGDKIPQLVPQQNEAKKPLTSEEFNKLQLENIMKFHQGEYDLGGSD